MLYFLYPVIAVGFSLGIITLIIYGLGISPIEGLGTLLYSSFGNAYYTTETLVRATPILLVALGLAVAFTAKVWNIGAEGQLYIGGIAAATIAINSGWMPAPIPSILAWIGAGVAGASWALIPALLKAKYEINEVFTTLMMNYIAIYLSSYLLHGPLMNPTTLFPETVIIPPSSQLAKLIPGYRLHTGVLFSFLILTPLVYIFLSKTIYGFRLKLVGSSPEVARTSGINIKKQILIAFLISGFFAGLAGANEVTGVVLKMRPEISPGYGYMGIGVALLGRLNPFGIVLASIFMAGIVNGSYTLSMMLKVPIGIANFILGILIVLIVLGEVLISRVIEARKASFEKESIKKEKRG